MAFTIVGPTGELVYFEKVDGTQHASIDISRAKARTAVFFRRPSKFSATLSEFKKQVDLAIYIFLGLIGCVVVFALGKIAWTWWTAL